MRRIGRDFEHIAEEERELGWALLGKAGLLDFGFRAVISTSIADIFKNNAVKNGLLPIEVANDIHQFLLSKPGLEIKIDLENCRIFVSEERVETFTIDGFARHCMLNGVDQLDFLLNQNTEISRFESSRT